MNSVNWAHSIEIQLKVLASRLRGNDIRLVPGADENSDAIEHCAELQIR
jgi:hypothetical protein